MKSSKDVIHMCNILLTYYRLEIFNNINVIVEGKMMNITHVGLETILHAEKRKMEEVSE